MSEEKMQECFKAAKYLKHLLEFDIKPRFEYPFLCAGSLRRAVSGIF